LLLLLWPTVTTIPDVDELIILHANSYGANNVHLGWSSESYTPNYRSARSHSNHSIEWIRCWYVWWTTRTVHLVADYHTISMKLQYEKSSTSSTPYVRTTTIDTMERRDCATILACIGITCVLGEICSMVYSGQQTSTTIPDVDELVILHGNSYGANNVHLGWSSDSKLQEYKPLERIKLKSGEIRRCNNCLLS
jgi:hypothetical protein